MASSTGTFTRYRNVVVLAFGNLVAIFGFAMFNPIMSFYLFDYLKMSMFIIGLVSAIFGVARALLLPLMGRISDRIGRKKMIVPALFSYSLVGYLYSTASTAFEFIGYRALQGVTSSTLWPASDALIADTVPPQERARALGAVSMTYQVGTMFAPSLGAIVAHLWGFKEVFYACALLAFVGAGLNLLFLREPRRTVQKEQLALKDVASSKEIKGKQPVVRIVEQDLPMRQIDSVIKARRRVIMLLGLMAFLLLFTFSTIDMILSIFIIAYYHTTLFDFALIYALFSVVGGIAAIIGGALADKYGRRRILAIVTAASILSWLSFAVADTLTLLTVLVTVFVFIATMNGPATSALLADLTPMEKRGATFGFLGVCNDLGLVAGPIICGVIFDFVSLSFGLDMLGGMQSIFVVNALVSLMAALVVYIGVREPRAKY